MSSHWRRGRIRDRVAATTQAALQERSRDQVEQQHRSAAYDPFGATVPRPRPRLPSPPQFIPGVRYYPPARERRGRHAL